MKYNELKRICTLLDRELYAARIDNISDSDQKILFAIRKSNAFPQAEDDYKNEEQETKNNDKNVKLLIDWNDLHQRIHLSQIKFEPHIPQAFTMLLRKHIDNKRIRNIAVDDRDRIVTIELGNRYETFRTMVAELTGKSAHIFLLNENGSILGSLPPDNARIPGQPYTRPVPPGEIFTAKAWPETSDEQLNNYLDQYYIQQEKREQFDKLYNLIKKQCTQRIKKESRLAANLENDLRRIEAAEQIRNQADLLSAYFHLCKKGDTSITLDMFDGSGKMTIPLKQELTPRENIDAMYTKYKKIQKSRPIAEERYLRNQETCDTLRQYTNELESIHSYNDFDTLRALEARIRKEMPGLLTIHNQPNAPSHKDTPHLPYREFHSEKGIAIRVGKSARDNDELTFRYANGNEFWLHVADGPGSHTVIKSTTPDSETILDAATLALHYAKGNHTQGEVLYLQCKYVKRIKGAPPGKVSTANPKVLYIKLDENRLRRLISAE